MLDWQEIVIKASVFTETRPRTLSWRVALRFIFRRVFFRVFRPVAGDLIVSVTSRDPRTGAASKTGIRGSRLGFSKIRDPWIRDF